MLGVHVCVCALLANSISPSSCGTFNRVFPLSLARGNEAAFGLGQPNSVALRLLFSTLFTGQFSASFGISVWQPADDDEDRGESTVQMAIWGYQVETEYVLIRHSNSRCAHPRTKCLPSVRLYFSRCGARRMWVRMHKCTDNLASDGGRRNPHAFASIILVVSRHVLRR